MTPVEMLAHSPVHSINDVAVILRIFRRDGITPNRRVVHELIRSGALRLIDPDQPVQRWSVSTVELERYIADGPRKGADIVPLRSAS